MKIEGYRSYHVSKPLKQKLVNSVYCIENMEHVLLEIYAEGFTGIGHVYAFSPSHAQSLKILVDSYCESLIGKDVDLVKKHWNDLYIRINSIGQTGLQIIALSAIDTALWDIMSQGAKLPLYKMLGAMRNEVDVYASGGWLGTIESLVEEAINYKEQGFKKYKMKIGSPDYREDIKRVAAVRKALGDDIEVMVDANQGLSIKKAISVSKELMNMDVTWFEEPVFAQDYSANAELVNLTDISIVSGESLFTKTEHLEIMTRRGVDILNPDLQRCGGVTEFMNVATMAAAFRIPVSSHLFTEISAHLIAAAPTGTILENVPEWWAGVFEKAPKIKDGKIKLDDTPGLGITFDHDFINKYKYE